MEMDDCSSEGFGQGDPSTGEDGTSTRTEIGGQQYSLVLFRVGYSLPDVLSP